MSSGITKSAKFVAVSKFISFSILPKYILTESEPFDKGRFSPVKETVYPFLKLVLLGTVMEGTEICWSS